MTEFNKHKLPIEISDELVLTDADSKYIGNKSVDVVAIYQDGNKVIFQNIEDGDEILITEDMVSINIE